ncbi:MAG: VOC family protein [Rhodospirillaceae bacterium]|nr:VOC family protein [Rhodospirillaceae bacterium]
MEHVISGLLNQFERGAMSRRNLVQTLAGAFAASAAAGPALAAQAKGFKTLAINHVSYGVADYGKTRDFYSDLLGMKVSKDDGKQCYLGFGDSFFVVRKTRQPDNKPFVDHIAYTIDNWDPAAVEAELKRRNLDPKMDAEKLSVSVKDPDGFGVQICSKEMKA